MIRVRAADDRALSDLYDRHAKLVFNLATAIVRNPQDAEEVTEDVFVQLWTSGDRFDPDRGTLRGWLAVMARTRALDLVRARSRRRSTHERAASHDETSMVMPPSSSDNADELVLRTELRTALDRALKVLNPDQRRAIELAYFSGLTQSEIAEQLAEPLGTVKTRLRDGMIRLKDAVSGQTGDIHE